ncbi:MAG: S41 family peptidase [Bacteroidales bacterium]|nr:S41 family peptidase [Bacteroidales bacterium]HPD94556.1 S41 family peptidase [Tenuifilaceae bacterium]HRX31178.1 S41 family peptidase [Tenuifilaceae bacterium]
MVKKMYKRIVLIGAFLAFSVLGYAQGVSSFSAYKFVRFIQYLSSNYVDTINVNKMVDDAIIDMLSQLDPHSVYISKEDVQAMNEPLEGNFDGIGVEFNIMNDTLMVVNPITGGPSERVGIIAGDRIIAIDGKPITNIGLKIPDVHKLLRGPKGTKVTVTISRKGVAQPLEFTITRDKIPIFSIDAAYMAKPNVGYIKISRFAATTEQEFIDAMNSLNKRKLNSLIIDLRNNGGGLLGTAYEIANYFIDKGKLIVYTEGRNSPRTNYISTGKGYKFNGKVVVLIDQGSASASEILTGALQDWDRALIVGRRSFGKGLVQHQLPLPDGSAIRLTVARYYTPTGREIQRPYHNGDVMKYYEDLNDRFVSGELFNRDSIHMSDSLKYKTLVKGKTVYGGGGIMPDVFVPLDTSFYTNYYGKLVRSGLLYQFALNWVDEHRSELLKEYKNFDKYNKSFEVSSELIDELTKLADSKKIEKNEEQLNISLAELKVQLKGLIAQSLFSSGYYYQVTNGTDETFLKALDVLDNWGKYKSLVVE